MSIVKSFPVINSCIFSFFLYIYDLENFTEYLTVDEEAHEFVADFLISSPGSTEEDEQQLLPQVINLWERKVRRKIQSGCLDTQALY